jgi:hypothetical protein
LPRSEFVASGFGREEVPEQPAVPTPDTATAVTRAGADASDAENSAD